MRPPAFFFAYTAKMSGCDFAKCKHKRAFHCNADGEAQRGISGGMELPPLPQADSMRSAAGLCRQAARVSFLPFYSSFPKILFNFATSIIIIHKMADKKKVLLGMSLGELKTLAAELGMPAFVGGQIARWLYKQHVTSIDGMTNISKTNRQRLAGECVVGCMPPAESIRSVDGTVKYLFPACGGKFVETVYIPDGDRATLCVSSQVGCKMNCLFCQTGKQGFEGNLSVADILNQVYSLPERETLTNIVFMGQGEPMDNIDNVMKATEVLTAEYGYGWSPKRITVSSVGVKNKLKRFLEESSCHVAISMHSPLPGQRAMLMPAERAMPLADIIALMRNYDFSRQRRLSFEYIVFGGVNDSELHAREIVRLLDGLECRVNLIRFHQIPGVDLHGADEEKMTAFRDYLTQHGVFTTIRASRGQDIYAACGLLSTARKEQETI